MYQKFALLSARCIASPFVPGDGAIDFAAAKTAVTLPRSAPSSSRSKTAPEFARFFRQRLHDIVGAPPLIPPHISLIYTLDGYSQAPRPDFDAERLKAIGGGGHRQAAKERYGDPVIHLL